MTKITQAIGSHAQLNMCYVLIRSTPPSTSPSKKKLFHLDKKGTWLKIYKL